MKAALLILGLTFGSFAFAQDYEQNRLDTIHYRTAEGRSYADLEWSGHIRDVESVDNANGHFDYKRSSLEGTLDYIYGINDKLYVSVVESYLNRATTDETVARTGNVNTFNSNGFSDPTFRANYRFLGGLTGSSFASAALELHPAFGSSQGADLGRDGNDISESTFVRAQGNYYGVCGHSEFLGRLQLTWNSSGLVNDKNPKASTDYNSYFTEDLFGEYRFHFADRFFVNGSLEATLPWYRDHQNSSSSGRTQQSNIVWTPTLGVGYLPIDSLLVTLAANYASYSQQNSVNNANGQANSQVYETSNWFVDVAYAF